MGKRFTITNIKRMPFWAGPPRRGQGDMPGLEEKLVEFDEDRFMGPLTFHVGMATDDGYAATNFVPLGYTKATGKLKRGTINAPAASAVQVVAQPPSGAFVALSDVLELNGTNAGALVSTGIGVPEGSLVALAVIPDSTPSGTGFGAFALSVG